jgi:hypothetical protein
MPVNIVEYKKTILDMFEYLTEADIKAAQDVMKGDHEAEKSTLMGMSYVLAINRCRHILQTILEGTTNANVNSSTDS